MRTVQADEFVPDKPLRYLGAAKTYAMRVRAYFGYPQFVMIAILFYYQSALIRSTFPTVWIWGAFLVLVGVAAMVFEYVVMHPAQIIYNAGQGSRENRNPEYRQVVENGRKIDDLLEAHAVADGGQTVVIPKCAQCGLQGRPGGHKGAPAWTCPDCGRILYRAVA